MAPGVDSPELRWNVEEIKTTPSRADGVPEREERALRFSGCDYARNLSRVLFNNDKSQEDSCNRVQILACYYLQSFFMFRSLRQEDAKTVAIAATFLACKVVDLPRKMRGILRALNQLRVQAGEAELGEEEQKKLCERVLKIEFLLLRIIRFEFDIDLPLDALAGLAEALLVQLTRCKEFCSACKGMPQQEAHALRVELIRVAQSFLLDSFMGFAPLLGRPRLVAAGALAIATRYIRREMPTSELCRLLHMADASLAETDVRHVVDEILQVFRTKSQVQAQAQAQARAAAAAGSGAGAAAATGATAAAPAA